MLCYFCIFSSLLAKMLRLRQTVHRTLRKCGARREICAVPCESAAPAANLYLTLRKCCACCEICRESCTAPCESVAPPSKCVPDLATVLCLPQSLCLTLPQNLHLTCAKHCACHEICTVPAKVLRLPQNEYESAAHAEVFLMPKNVF